MSTPLPTITEQELFAKYWHRFMEYDKDNKFKSLSRWHQIDGMMLQYKYEHEQQTKREDT